MRLILSIFLTLFCIDVYASTKQRQIDLSGFDFSIEQDDPTESTISQKTQKKKLPKTSRDEIVIKVDEDKLQSDNVFTIHSEVYRSIQEGLSL